MQQNSMVFQEQMELFFKEQYKKKFNDKVVNISEIVNKNKEEINKMINLIMKIEIESNNQSQFLGEIMNLEEPHQQVISKKLERILNEMMENEEENVNNISVVSNSTSYLLQRSNTKDSTMLGLNDRNKMWDQIETLENDCMYMQEEIKEKDLKIMNLQSELKESNKEVEQHKEKLRLLQIENMTIKETEPEKQQEVNDDFQVKLAQSQKKIMELKNQIYQMSESYERELGLLGTKIEQQDQKIVVYKQVEKKLQKREEQVQKLQELTSYSNIQSMQQTYDKQIDIKEKEVDQYKDRCEALVQKFDQNDKKIVELEQELAMLKNELVAVRSDNDRLSAKIQMKEQEFQDIVSNMENYEQKEDQSVAGVDQLDFSVMLRNIEQNQMTNSEFQRKLSNCSDNEQFNPNQSLLQSTMLLNNKIDNRGRGQTVFGNKDNKDIQQLQKEKDQLTVQLLKQEKINQENIQLKNDLESLKTNNEQLTKQINHEQANNIELKQQLDTLQRNKEESEQKLELRIEQLEQNIVEVNRSKEKADKFYEMQKQQIQEEQSQELEKVMKENYKLKQQYVQQKDVVTDLNGALDSYKEILVAAKKDKLANIQSFLGYIRNQNDKLKRLQKNDTDQKKQMMTNFSKMMNKFRVEYQQLLGQQ